MLTLYYCLLLVIGLIGKALFVVFFACSAVLGKNHKYDDHLALQLLIVKCTF